MAAAVLTSPTGANAGSPATTTITTNSRVRSQSGFLALQTDVPQFPGPPVTGVWTVAATRTFVQSVPVVTQTAVGVAAIPAPPSSVPMSVTMGDARVKAS
ncbi:MAG: hypothetical protein U9R07_02550 [Pseudomonadota bacterium]|nr:hypothetical protein [Pseudomonadota bacterium]